MHATFNNSSLNYKKESHLKKADARKLRMKLDKHVNKILYNPSMEDLVHSPTELMKQTFSVSSIRGSTAENPKMSAFRGSTAVDNRDQMKLTTYSLRDSLKPL